MSTEKPLHVRVAEALEWTGCHEVNGTWWGQTPIGDIRGVTRYDTDWSATGPLIERFCIALTPDDNSGEWLAVSGQIAEPWGRDEVWGYDTSIGPAARGETPLVAACNLILALAAAGKLDA